ncbi:hypothetical protein [Natranaerobius trueperi]|uniref:Uncharacterized protein n=1 Tax=Natranaerobius trueperi TaxID=759412 RepID=A0A226BUF9_9FIRM|nr:hypothetical protein [Natranaerobius trueperi]OWZ82668.1 hypothetical protein CDO51_12850 [Natranaerobius trueperi]
MDLNQFFILLAIVVGIVIFLRILKATLKLIVIVAIVVLIAGYLGFDLMEVGRDVYDRVEDPMVELVEDGMNITDDLLDNNSIVDGLSGPISTLEDLGFGVDVTDEEVEFWEGDSFKGNVNVEDSQLSLQVDLSDESNKDLVIGIVEGLEDDTVSKETKQEMIAAIKEQEDKRLKFEEGYLDIEDNFLDIKVKTTNKKVVFVI